MGICYRKAYEDCELTLDLTMYCITEENINAEEGR